MSDSGIPWTVAHQAPLSMGVLQARLLEWVAMPSSRGSSQPRDWTQVSHIVANSLPSEPLGKPKNTGVGSLSLLGGSSWPRNWTGVSCIAGGLFTSWATREALEGCTHHNKRISIIPASFFYNFTFNTHKATFDNAILLHSHDNHLCKHILLYCASL